MMKERIQSDLPVRVQQGLAKTVGLDSACFSADGSRLYLRESIPAGYIGTIWFTSRLIDCGLCTTSCETDDASVLGGCVELYSDADEAASRNNVLSSYDGVLFLSSGSHRALHNAVIRVSRLLNAVQQEDLIQRIESALKNILI